MLTLDTSGVLALVDADDPDHERARLTLEASPRPYLIPLAILAEISYFLESRGTIFVLDAFLGDIESGYFTVHCGEGDIARMRQLVRRYSDLPLGTADASVVACAERHGGSVLSLDKDFFVVAREGKIAVVTQPLAGA